MIYAIDTYSCLHTARLRIRQKMGWNGYKYYCQTYLFSSENYIVRTIVLNSQQFYCIMVSAKYITESKQLLLAFKLIKQANKKIISLWCLQQKSDSLTYLVFIKSDSIYLDYNCSNSYLSLSQGACQWWSLINQEASI